MHPLTDIPSIWSPPGIDPDVCFKLFPGSGGDLKPQCRVARRQDAIASGFVPRGELIAATQLIFQQDPVTNHNGSPSKRLQKGLIKCFRKALKRVINLFPQPNVRHKAVASGRQARAFAFGGPWAPSSICGNQKRPAKRISFYVFCPGGSGGPQDVPKGPPWAFRETPRPSRRPPGRTTNQSEKHGNIF
jgi:hypothetical protein